jgi:two-component system LytT family response regulator
VSAPRLRALVVEDEPHARQNLVEYLAEAPWLELVGEAADGEAAVRLIDELAPDVVFLDVRLPECSGLEVLARARHRCEVVFTTAHDGFAIAAFELGALDYLLKPFGRQRFLAALERVRQRLLPAASPAAAERAAAAFATPLRRLFARTPRGIVPVEARTIRHVQARGDYVEVTAEAGRFLLHTSLAELAARLDPEQFVQVHRSHLVNLDAVELLAGFDARRLEVVLRDGTRIVASRAASERLRALAR